MIALGWVVCLPCFPLTLFFRGIYEIFVLGGICAVMEYTLWDHSWIIWVEMLVHTFVENLKTKIFLSTFSRDKSAPESPKQTSSSNFNLKLQVDDAMP